MQLTLSFFSSFLLLLSLVFGYYFVYHHHHHHHHHHYHHYYNNFIIILAIITIVWRICILNHNQSLKFYVILKHLHFWAEQPSLNPFIFPTFPFSILTIRVVPWGTTITWQLYNNILRCFLFKNLMLCRRCSMPWSSSSSSSNWL